MRAYGSNLAASIKRIKKTHKRTKFVSALYTFATFVLTILMFFPIVNVNFAGKDSLFIGTFFRPILNIFENNLNILDLITMVLYIAMLVVVGVNFIKCGSRCGKIMRRNSGNVTTCNKNLLIMEEIADAFSAAFSAFIIFNLIIYMINYATTPAPKAFALFGDISLWGVIAVAIYGAYNGDLVMILRLGVESPRHFCIILLTKLRISATIHLTIRLNVK